MTRRERMAAGRAASRTDPAGGVELVIPFYDAITGRDAFVGADGFDLESITASVTHIVTADPSPVVSGYSEERTFGAIRILRRDAEEPDVRAWQEYAPTIDTGVFADVVRELFPDAPPLPLNSGIRFADEGAGRR